MTGPSLPDPGPRPSAASHPDLALCTFLDRRGRTVQLRLATAGERARTQAMIARAVSAELGQRVEADEVVLDATDTAIPAWFITEPGCAHPDACGCCRVELAEAIAGLDADQRTGAVSAHLGLLHALLAHQGAARVQLRGQGGTPGCGACVLDPAEHLAGLEEVYAARCGQLVAATAEYETVLLVGASAGELDERARLRRP